MIFFLLFTTLFAQYVQFPKQSGTIKMISLDTCFRSIDSYLLYKQTENKIYRCEYSDSECKTEPTCEELDETHTITNEIPQHAAIKYTSENCDTNEQYFMNVYLKGCQSLNAGFYLKYQINGMDLEQTFYSDSECKKPIPDETTFLKCNECKEVYDKKETLRCGQQIDPNKPNDSDRTDKPKFVMSNAEIMKVIYPLDVCIHNNGEAGKMFYFTETSIKMCTYENDECEGDGICHEVPLIELGMEYLDEMLENVAYAQMATDAECKKIIEGAVLVFSTDCIDLMKLYDEMDNTENVKRDQLKKDLSLYMKYVVEDNEILMEMYLDSECDTIGIEQKIGDCDKCTNFDDMFPEEEDTQRMKRSIQKKTQMLKRENSAGIDGFGQPQYLTIVCDSFSGVSSTMILLILVALFILF